MDVTRLGTQSSDNIDMSLRTSDLDDLLFGLDGADTIVAGRGNDFLYGGDGIDVLDGGAGLDVSGGESDGYDHLEGGEGDDVLYGGPGDTLTGGPGNDTFHLFTGNVVQLINDGVLLPGGDDPRYLDPEKWHIRDTHKVENDVVVTWERFAIPIVKITDFEQGDKLFVDGKLITGKQVTFSWVDDELGHCFQSGTFSWMEAIGTADRYAPYSSDLVVFPNGDGGIGRGLTETYYEAWRHEEENEFWTSVTGILPGSSFEFSDEMGESRYSTNYVNYDLTAALIVHLPNLQEGSGITDSTVFL